MVVTCPKCSTSYEFDETLVGPKGTVVRCTQCSHMFKIFSDESDESIRKAGWMVRKQGGKVFGIDRFATIQKWIREGKITDKDELSRTGKHWKQIKDIVELQKLFVEMGETQAPPAPGASKQDQITVEPRLSIQADDALLDSFGGRPMGGGADRVPAPATKAAAPERPARVEQEKPTVRYQTPETEEGTAKGPLARSMVPSEPDLPPDETDRMLMPGYRPGRTKKIVIVVVLLVLAGLGVVGYLERNLIMGWLADIRDPASEGEHDKALERAREYFLLDTASYFDQSEKIFRDLLSKDEHDVGARAGLAELLTAQAQYIRDDKLILGADDAKSDSGTLIREATKLAKLAVLSAPESLEANRALADALRLSDDVEGAREAIGKALEVAPRDPDALYIAVLIDHDDGLDLGSAIEDLERIVKQSSSLIRVRYRLALFYAMDGRFDECKAETSAILEINPDHVLSKKLLGKIEAGTFPVPTEPPPEDVVAEGEGETEAGEGTEAGTETQAGEGTETVAGEAGSGTKSAGGGSGGGGGAPSGKSFDFYLNKAVKLQHSGSCSQATEYFQKALQINPKSVEAHSGSGYCYMSKGQYAPAVSSFKQALKSNKNFGPASIGLAQAYEKKGDDKSALAQYKKYLDTHSSGAQAALARNKVKQLEASLGSSASESDKPPAGDGATETPPPKVETEVEIKGSAGQPSSDTPTTAGDPYP